MRGSSGGCLRCGRTFESGVAYLSGGALLLDESLENSITLDQHQAFLHLGFHGPDPAVRDSADMCLVDHLPGGQFEFSFCTIDCLEAWLLEKLADLRKQLAANIARMNDQSEEPPPAN